MILFEGLAVIFIPLFKPKQQLACGTFPVSQNLQDSDAQNDWVSGLRLSSGTVNTGKQRKEVQFPETLGFLIFRNADDGQSPGTY
jgi:hypothetical protein